MNSIITNVSTTLMVALLSQTAFALNADTVASVNGVNITQKEYQEHMKQRSAAQNQQARQAPVSRQIVLDELINREILLQEAKKLKLDKDKAVIEQLANIKKNLLIQALITRSPAAKPVGEKELKEVYDQEIGKADPTEYNTRNILVKDEATAKNIIEKLNDGANFEELAKNESTGQEGKNGGDLGWLSTAQMPPEFAQATTAMKKGTHSQTPVKTQFGWHIIKLEDSRKRELPKFEDVKNQIAPMIQNKRLQEYVLKLRSNAKIEIK